MDSAIARERALDAAEELFYARGIQAVGMDAIRTASGVSLKRLYQLFPNKERLIDAYLERRDLRWRAQLAERVDQETTPRRRILAVYAWLYDWFREPGFRGCAWINGYGELGATSPAVAERARAHKQAFKDYLTDLTTAAGLPEATAEQLRLLAEGAMATAGIMHDPESARHAERAAALLITADTQVDTDTRRIT
ncbi:TetR/AcrR family transcriptional regulator [Streptomyces apocyni]|uniref:TetR/AcrR family transcriptional regulator n=1 Tax=Streptomyces apocyni TaxID=2654677 RepID=UPI0012EA4B8B|nr:TetR/AcrR family transcriptional regulator [Streptomyces apocyni]